MARVWIDGPKFCNYVEDDKRVLGQVVTIGIEPKWQAYDNTKLNKSKTTALPIGVFDTLAEAKAAVEKIHESFRKKLDDLGQAIGEAIGEAKFGE
jgi:hypothetical protein